MPRQAHSLSDTPTPEKCLRSRSNNEASKPTERKSGQSSSPKSPTLTVGLDKAYENCLIFFFEYKPPRRKQGGKYEWTAPIVKRVKTSHLHSSQEGRGCDLDKHTRSI
jgi:hypothetical protein